MGLILIADDNDDLRMIMKIILKDRFQILEAKNGKQAVDLFSLHKPDLIFMDILMPVMNGIEATKEIMKKDPKAQVVALTAYSARTIEILNAGAKEVLRKPIRKNDLIMKVNKYVPVVGS